LLAAFTRSILVILILGSASTGLAQEPSAGGQPAEHPETPTRESEDKSLGNQDEDEVDGEAGAGDTRAGDAGRRFEERLRRPGSLRRLLSGRERPRRVMGGSAAQELKPIDRPDYGETTLHPLGVLAVLVLGLFALLASRRAAIVPLLAAACAIPMAQRLVIFGADFTMLRILVVAYFFRVMIRGEFRGVGRNRLDTAMLMWSICGTVVMTIAHGTTTVFINRLGWSFDMLGIYFVGRFLIRSWSDLKFTASAMAVLSLPTAILFAVEYATQYNVFSIFGGVPAETWLRGGRLRCQGAFVHPILAGTFWASALPLIWTLRKQNNFLMYLGTFNCLLIVATVSSSTAILSVLLGVGGVALFRWRRHRRRMWMGLFALLAALHVVMKKPVWHLMARVDLTGGSTGHHRYRIFDAFVNNFSKWYLTGETSPMSWGVWEMRDITNTYMVQGLTGGLLTLVVFLLVLIFAYGNVGRALDARAIIRSPKRQWICWCIGVAIFVHTVTFLAVAYLGQMTVMLYLELSLTSSVYIFAMRDSRKLEAKYRLQAARAPRRAAAPQRGKQLGV
jgi:hypothetical protein